MNGGPADPEPWPTQWPDLEDTRPDLTVRIAPRRPADPWASEPLIEPARGPTPPELQLPPRRS